MSSSITAPEIDAVPANSDESRVDVPAGRVLEPTVFISNLSMLGGVWRIPGFDLGAASPDSRRCGRA